MEPLGINTGMLLMQLIVLLLIVGLPIASLIDLARKKLTGTPLVLWALLICIVPLLGPLAYWIVKPTPETRA